MQALQTFVNIPQCLMSPHERTNDERTHVNNLRCRRHDLSIILKLQADFLYSIYPERAGKTSLFYMRGVDFMHFNTCEVEHAL